MKGLKILCLIVGTFFCICCFSGAAFGIDPQNAPIKGSDRMFNPQPEPPAASQQTSPVSNKTVNQKMRTPAASQQISPGSDKMADMEEEEELQTRKIKAIDPGDDGKAMEPLDNPAGPRSIEPGNDKPALHKSIEPGNDKPAPLNQMDKNRRMRQY